MKLISLNIWGGNVYDPLMKFIKDNKDNIDIFCFHEVFADCDREQIKWFLLSDSARIGIYQEIANILSDHVGRFCPIYDSVYGIATFIRKDIEIVKEDHVLLFEPRCFPDPENPMTDHARKMQCLEIKRGNVYRIFNVHGHWVPGNKLDNENRLEQSRRIVEKIQQSDLPIIMCGDFNLEPQTESIAMIEQVPMSNLIKKYNVQSTRTSLYKKKGNFADYIFINDGIAVREFRVMPDEVSDHAALYIEFE